MTIHEERLLLLEAHVDGELDTATEAEVRRFLAGSAEGRRWVEERRRLLAALGELPEAIEPARDLWPAVAGEIVAEPEREAPPATDRAPAASWRPWLLAASLVAALAAGFVLGRGRPAAPGATTPEPIAAIATPASADGGGLVVGQAEAALVAAKQDLRRALDAHRANLPAATLATVDENLAAIERAIGEIRVALAEDPSDATLRRTLVAYHEREVALLTRVTRAAARL